MSELEEIRVFVQLVESKSATLAAERLGLAVSAVSRRMKGLEERLGVQLVQRTTRRMSLTEQGQFYFERCRRILDDLEETEQRVRSSALHLSGNIRIAAPTSFGVAHLMPVIATFMHLHPDINVEIDMSDRKVDLLEEGIDVGIRLGELSDSTLKARKLGRFSHLVCASPEFLLKYGMPKTPDDLSSFPALCYSNLANPGSWPYTDGKGLQGRAKVKARLAVDNGEAIREAAIAGVGIACEPTFIIYKAIERGLLTPVLTDYSWYGMDIYAIYAQTRFVSARVRTFIDYMTEQFSATPQWEAHI